MQMCRILLSINPEHVENILSGKKTYEYRKKLCKRKVDKIVIYSTCPVKQIVGEVEVLESISMEKENLWKATKNSSGISKKFYNNYFRDKKVAGAYKLGKVTTYSKPYSLEEYGLRVAPQSYMYLPESAIV